MGYPQTGCKKNRTCATCQFWSGKGQARVDSVNFFKISSDASGKCNITGFTKKWNQCCSDHEFRNDF